MNKKCKDKLTSRKKPLMNCFLKNPTMMNLRSNDRRIRKRQNSDYLFQ